MTATNKLTLTQIAFELGAYDRITKEATKPLRDAYAKADEATAREMRHNWIQGYMAGNLKTTEEKIVRLMEEKSTREFSEAQRKSYDRARSQFTYHVAKPRTVTAENSPQNDDIANLLKIARTASVNLAKKDQKRFAAAMLELLAEFDLIETGV